MLGGQSFVVLNPRSVSFVANGIWNKGAQSVTGRATRVDRCNYVFQVALLLSL